MENTIESNQQAIDSTLSEADPSLLGQIWKRRAEHLAQIPVREDTGEQIQLLIFRLGREYYGVEARFVFDIRVTSDITLVPRVPDWVVGVVNMRGRILSVIDLRRFFNLPGSQSVGDKTPQAEGQPVSYQVLVETPEMELALLVDEVLAVEDFPRNKIESTNEVIGEMRLEYVRGIVNYKTNRAGENNVILVVLNLVTMLGDKRLVIEEKII